MIAKKYMIGKLARKHLLNAIEVLFTSDEDTIVYHKTNGNPYEIRARRVPHGIELKWAKPGTFYQPDVREFRTI